MVKIIDLFLNIFSEKRAMTTYLTASIGGIVALALLIFTIYIFTKYRCVALIPLHLIKSLFQNRKKEEETCY